MGSSIRTLNVHAPWAQTLAALDVRVETHGLPARVRCPLCSGPRMTIYEDNIYGGGWHYCFDCDSRGDMIDLAAAVWQVSTPVAVRRLRDAGLPFPDEAVETTVLARHVADHVQKRQRITEFIEKAGAYFYKTGGRTLALLRDRFRLDSDIPQDRWLRGPANVVGAYPHVWCEKVLMPGSVVGSRCVSAARAFKGRGWGDVLVVPHYDLPGRACGFLFVGRGGDKADRLFRHMAPAGMRRVGYAEGGLACHWAIHNSHGMCGDHVVACGDPYLAVRLHIRHFAVARTALPLVAYHDGTAARTLRAWQSLVHKVPVLWGWRMTPALLFQAMQADGKLCLTELQDTTQKRIDHFVRNAEPRTIVKRIVKEAKPWREYLRDWGDRVTDGMVEDLLVGIETYGIDPGVFRDVGPRFASLARVAARPRLVRVQRSRILERDDQLWFRASETAARDKDRDADPVLIMNASLRLDGSEVRQVQGEETLFYRGQLLHAGDAIPFEVPALSLRKNMANTLELILARNKPGSLLYVAEGWQAKILAACLAFSSGIGQ